MDYSLLQRSLLEDLKQNPLYRSLVPRAAHDSLYKAVMHESLTDTVYRYKALNAVLMNDAEPKYVFPNGYTLPLTGRPEIVRCLRQSLGLLSRLSANVTDDVRNAQLQDAKERVSRPPVFSVSLDDVCAMREFLQFLLGATPPHPDTWPMGHGPGAVAECPRSEKVRFERIPSNILKLANKYYTVETYRQIGPDGTVSWKFQPMGSDRWFKMPNAPTSSFGTMRPSTRVCTVPKDALKVRIISCEPAASQFVQQGLMNIIYDKLSRWPVTNPLDQTRNQRLAMWGSICHTTATLDSSDASDNIRWLHVQKLFPADWVIFFSYLRSTHMLFPDGDLVELSTFAPMGSALSFGVELAVFAAIGFASARRFDPHLKPAAFLVDDRTGFFGDDAIITNCCVASYLEIASNMAIPINESKSCWGDAHFRESCGLDCFEGHDVSIVRPRDLSDSRTAYAPMVQHANRLVAAGFARTAQVIANRVKAPVSLGVGPDLADPRLRWPHISKVRYNTSLQRFEGQAPFNRAPASEPLQGWAALHAWFSSQRQSSSPFLDKTPRAIPSLHWVPLEACYAFQMAAQRHCGIKNSVGHKAYARGTPSGSDPLKVLARQFSVSHLPGAAAASDEGQPREW